MYLYRVLPDTEMEIVDSQDEVLIGGHEIQSYDWSVATLLVPIRYYCVVLTASLIGRPRGPVADKQLALVRSSCEYGLFLVLIEGKERPSHGTSAFRAEQVEPIPCLPHDS